MSFKDIPSGWEHIVSAVDVQKLHLLDERPNILHKARRVAKL
jgi:hypothetical protein